MEKGTECSTICLKNKELAVSIGDFSEIYLIQIKELFFHAENGAKIPSVHDILENKEG
jgi:hypothetical protein